MALMEGIRGEDDVNAMRAECQNSVLSFLDFLLVICYFNHVWAEVG
jgi:hypothetical protein